MNIRNGITSDKSLRFTFGNIHEMPKMEHLVKWNFLLLLWVYSLKLDGVMCVVFFVSDTKNLGLNWGHPWLC